MKELLVLLSLLFTSDNTIYIVTDDSCQSNIIKQEMNRNWFKGVKEPYPELIKEIATIQCNLHGSVILIDYYDKKLHNEHRITRMTKYPQYRIGEYKEFKEFDPRTFTASGSAIMTINAIKNNSDVNENDWKEECEKITKKAKYEYINNIIVWGQINSITEINETYYFEDNESAPPFDDFIKKYETYKDFPKYKPPKLPETPVLKMPWER